MSNLGAYQLMTTVAKKVGGPVVLAMGTAISGWVVLRAAEAGAKKAYQGARAKVRGKAPVEAEASELFELVEGLEAGGGLKLRAGDKFRVLESDGDSVLIEVVGADKNPYFASGASLEKVSNFSMVNPAAEQ